MNASALNLDCCRDFPFVAGMKIPSELLDCGANLALVLGSGLASFTDTLPRHAIVPYSTIDTLPVSGAPGHEGSFLVTQIGPRRVVIACGRVHLYEGWNAREVSSHVRLLHECGIKKLVLTNAAGAIHEKFHPGSWMLISDHLNLTGDSALRGGAHFFDMTEIYSHRLRGIFHQSCPENAPLHEGVYAGVMGPQFETPAEIKMLRLLGADAVGMSTVQEAIQARALGMEVAGLSCMTNWAAGISGKPLGLEEVIETGRQAVGTLKTLLELAISEI